MPTVTESAKHVFSFLMQKAQRVRLSQSEKSQLSRARQMLRRAARPVSRNRKLSRGKARQILREGQAGGYPLTARQRGFFGARAAGLPLKNPTLGEAVDYRLKQIRQTFESHTERTGRSGYDPETGQRTRRMPGIKDAFPELRTLEDTPSSIARAIERGRGKVYQRVRRQVSSGLSTYYSERKRSEGRPTVPAHKGRVYCARCRMMHTKGQHRFHGKGSYLRTHLFPFENPPMRLRIYKRLGTVKDLGYDRQVGRFLGLYKHQFDSRASVYVLKPRGILII